MQSWNKKSLNGSKTKLIARTEEDLTGNHITGSPATQILKFEKNKIFLMQLNRFMWEDVEKGVFRKKING